MCRAKFVAGFGGIAILGLSTMRVAACDGTGGPCACPGELTLGTVSHSPGQSTFGTLGFTPPAPPPSTLATQNVHVFNFDFSTNPSGMPIMDAVINVGDTVHWTWDSGLHSVTSVAGSIESFNSGNLSAPGPTFDHTFTHAGVFTYYCDIHGFDIGDGTAGGMFGTITVGAPSSTWNVDFDGSWNTASN